MFYIFEHYILSHENMNCGVVGGKQAFLRVGFEVRKTIDVLNLNDAGTSVQWFTEFVKKRS